MKMKENYIMRMARYWVGVEKLYDKLVPMYRKVSRSEHRMKGNKTAIKKVIKELSMVKKKASSTTRKFNRTRYNVDIELD